MPQTLRKVWGMSDTRRMTAKGMNPTTGTVHQARTETLYGLTGLVQTCGMNTSRNSGQLNFLFEVADDTEVTCRRCSKAHTKAAAKPAAKTTARASSGPVTWGVYSAAGTLRTWRTTRREALAVADADETVRKV